MHSSLTRVVATTLFGLAFITIPSIAGRLTYADVLSAYHNKNRILLIFSPSSSDPRFITQTRLFAASTVDGFTDRDLLVIPNLANSRSDPRASTLRMQYHLAPQQFRVMLIGKDGHVAYSSEQPVAATELFGRIDRMPMRLEEMRRKGEL